MSRVVHFELSADDPQRASKFYEDVFGWQVNSWGGPKDYWLVTTGPDDQPGINGGIQQREAALPSCVNTIDVASVDACLAKIKANGGAPVIDKMAIPGVGYLAYCRDTEGNVFGIMETDESAQV